jgi:16S rRNA (guanine527-N7)-methyltransferase
VTATKPAPDDLSALDGIVSVSRETAERLERFVGLLTKWQAADNLVAVGTLPMVWRRHVADSAQLVSLFPETRQWLDLGSGAGFPGLVTAILLADVPGARVHLVESNVRKCAFLRQAIRETGAAAEVHQGRIEAVLADWSEPIERISARGLASLDRLFALSEPVLAAGAAGAFHKGQDYRREIEESAQAWDFDLVIYSSKTESRSAILDISNVKRKGST